MCNSKMFKVVQHGALQNKYGGAKALDLSITINHPQLRSELQGELENCCT